MFQRTQTLNKNFNPDTNLIGVRIPDNNFIRGVCCYCSSAVALTSANYRHVIQISLLHTVGENVIAITKIRNNYCAIQSFKFPILDFSLLLLVKLSLLILFASFLVYIFFYGSLSKVIALQTIMILKVVAINGDSEKQYRKEAMNQSTKLIQKLKQRD